MSKTIKVHAQVESELKKQAEARFLEWGVTVDEAITRFYENVVSCCAYPFSPHIPNAETIEAMEEARSGEGLTEYASLDDLKAKFS